jgi:DNA recombination protein RmuC
MTETIVIAVVMVAAIGISTWWLARRLSQPRDDQSLVLLQNQVNALGAQVAQAMDTSRKSMDERLDNAARVIQGVSQQLGQLDASSRRMIELGKDISGLQDILRAPKLRGNLSELFLGDLLSQIMPADHYRMQHSFRSGETVDAVIILKAGMVPVDAKFPLENFKRIYSTDIADEQKARMRKDFLNDVKKHIDAIRDKYIKPGEGTFEFALMYIPSETIYYEIITRDEKLAEGTSLVDYAKKAKVIPVSPNSFYVYLQVIIYGLKGMEIEKSAREIQDRLRRTQTDFKKFFDHFQKIGGKIDLLQREYENAVKRFELLDRQVSRITGQESLLTEEPAGETVCGDQEASF